MSFKEVKELRINGKLDEALSLAQKNLEEDPNNVWNIRSISWVYYDYLKQNESIESYDQFISFLDKVLELNISDEDAQMLHENIAIQIGKLIFSLFRQQIVDVSKVDELFEKCKYLKISRPSNANSFLIKAFLKGNKSWPGIFKIYDHFGFDSFQENDYKPEEFNGKAIPSIVEKYYNTICKKLIDIAKDGLTSKVVIDHQLEEFLPILDVQIEKNPEYQFLPYFKAKILIQLGRKEQVIDAFLPFAKRKKNEFWVWEVIAETFEKTDDNYFACICKALSLKSPEDYLVGLRKEFAELLIERKLYPEAKFEINRIIEIRNKNGWKIPGDLISFTEQSWFIEAEEKKNNFDLYNQNKPQAEALLFKDVEEEIIAVEFVNSDKQILNFVKNQKKHGFFSYKGFIKSPKIGDIYRVRFTGDSKEGFHKLLSLSEAQSNEQSEAIKTFEGQIRINEQGRFGFVDDVFIEPNFINKLNIQQSQKVSGNAILSFNKKKSQWGWKVLTINSI